MKLHAHFERMHNRQCELLIDFLSSERISFSLICEVSKVVFAPPLPSEILNSFQTLSLFALSGYTLDSLTITHNGIAFEAGFGKDNIGSLVQIRFQHILQIIIRNHNHKEVAIFTRLNARELFGSTEQDELRNSMQAILANPHNRRFFE